MRFRGSLAQPERREFLKCLLTDLLLLLVWRIGHRPISPKPPFLHRKPSDLMREPDIGANARSSSLFCTNQLPRTTRLLNRQSALQLDYTNVTKGRNYSTIEAVIKVTF